MWRTRPRWGHYCVDAFFRSYNKRILHCTKSTRSIWDIAVCWFYDALCYADIPKCCSCIWATANNWGFIATIQLRGYSSCHAAYRIRSCTVNFKIYWRRQISAIWGLGRFNQKSNVLQLLSPSWRTLLMILGLNHCCNLSFFNFGCPPFEWTSYRYIGLTLSWLLL